MHFLVRTLSRLAKWRFNIMGRASILDITEHDFERVMHHLKTEGWRLTSRYRGFDAGIDYDRLRFKKRGVRLLCEWDNWHEWSVEGPARTIQDIASAVGLTAKAEWRWTRWH